VYDKTRRLKNLIGEKSMISYSDHCGVAQSREQTPPLAERVSKTHMIHELASGTASVVFGWLAGQRVLRKCPIQRLPEQGQSEPIQ
jgi:hypothetical protein